MFIRNEDKQYDTCIIRSIEKIGLKFEIFENFYAVNSNIEIFFCHHIKKSEVLLFYEFLISYYFPHYKMTIDMLYTILWFLEYFRAKEIHIMVINKVSFHFSKQDYFSHVLYKKISQEYCKIIKFDMNSVISYSTNENLSYFFIYCKGLYANDKKHILIINDKLNLFLERYKIFTYTESKEKEFDDFDDILFYMGSIYDETIRSINNNINFVDLKNIILIKSQIKTSLSFHHNLSKINGFIFYENTFSDKGYEVFRIKDLKNIDIGENIIQNIKHPFQKFVTQNQLFIMSKY
ncbi:hypothetical protein CWI38_1890p0020 [Hamiltosporidium tvaerminnensis]|uniref:Uncharacterized protein n=3 Tax=Hamiltosporidium TaxID=1176354 RepID=A0A4Q9LPC0_9MICR|nr:hypothetical protein CWI38_1890p0020 [Hamiltosporidium tvaerminnensis]